MALPYATPDQVRQIFKEMNRGGDTPTPSSDIPDISQLTTGDYRLRVKSNIAVGDPLEQDSTYNSVFINTELTPNQVDACIFISNTANYSNNQLVIVGSIDNLNLYIKAESIYDEEHNKNVIIYEIYFGEDEYATDNIMYKSTEGWHNDKVTSFLDLVSQHGFTAMWSSNDYIDPSNRFIRFLFAANAPVISNRQYEWVKYTADSDDNLLFKISDDGYFGIYVNPFITSDEIVSGEKVNVYFNGHPDVFTSGVLKDFSIDYADIALNSLIMILDNSQYGDIVNLVNINMSLYNSEYHNITISCVDLQNATFYSDVDETGSYLSDRTCSVYRC